MTFQEFLKLNSCLYVSNGSRGSTFFGASSFRLVAGGASDSFSEDCRHPILRLTVPFTHLVFRNSSFAEPHLPVQSVPLCQKRNVKAHRRTQTLCSFLKKKITGVESDLRSQKFTSVAETHCLYPVVREAFARNNNVWTFR